MTSDFVLSELRAQSSEAAFSTAELLQARAKQMHSRRKRIRTRAQLIAVTASQLESLGYDSLTIESVAKEAGLVRGTVYLHFKHKTEMVKAVLRKHWALMRVLRPSGGELNLFESIHRANTYSVNIALKNPGLLRAREILMREDHSISKRMATVNQNWTGRILRDLMRRELIGADAESLAFNQLKVRAVINMSDTLLADIPRMSEWGTGNTILGNEMIVRVMNSLWYRALYMPGETAESMGSGS